MKKKGSKVPIEGDPHDEKVELYDLEYRRADLVDYPAIPKTRARRIKESDPYKNVKQGTVLPYQNLPVDENLGWDSGAARRELRSWSKENVSRYRRGFMIVDGDRDNLTSYKYPIARVRNGRLVVPFRALSAALGRGLQNLPRETFHKMVNMHIRRYYRKVGRELPESAKNLASSRYMKMGFEQLMEFSGKIEDEDLRSQFLDLISEYDSGDNSPATDNDGNEQTVTAELLKDPRIDEILSRLEKLESTDASDASDAPEEVPSTDTPGGDRASDDVVLEVTSQVDELTPLAESGDLDEEGMALLADLSQFLTEAVSV